MKPLILWARAKHPEPYVLRLGPHDHERVTGLVKIGETWQPFAFERERMTITIGEGEAARRVQINEWGWEYT